MPLPPLVPPGPELSPAEALRVSRQSRLPEVGGLGQRRLANAKVCVVGAGGLGSPAILYLAAAGVGTIGIVDDDVVEPTNLQRQVAHGTAALGRSKAWSAAERARELNPAVDVRSHELRLDAGNARDVLSGYDLVLDGSDTFDTRAVIDGACASLGIPVVWAAVLGFHAQVTVFWADPPLGAGVRQSDVFGSPGDDGASCETAGVFGPLCGQVGSIMAGEAVKLITGIGEPLLGRLLDIDARTWRQREVRLRPVPAQSAPVGPATETAAGRARVPRVTADVLRAMLSEPAPPVVLDVREPYEHASGTIPGALRVPLADVLSGERRGIPDGRPIVVYCLRHARAEAAAQALVADGYPVSVLDGGMHAWATA
ncbi:ThiF family adenylyltransferase [Rathayibacter sp. KR2-224]|uniref:ThiF family adenylyltransferase n=1 Tax=Rathayibacter sp. KR2-224 TaxID=3400913 RepID=UPI003C1078EA